MVRLITKICYKACIFWADHHIKVVSGVGTAINCFVELDECDIVFQQNGARVHIARATVNMSKEFFGDQLIASGLWPPRIPNFTPPFFLLAKFYCKFDKILNKICET